jgi:DNA-directed RNA polymerase specialized sigma24 family protein
MYRLIDQLDEDEKMITFLFIDRVRVKQIASATGKSVDAVKQAIRRIKNKLRMLYEKEKDNDR